MKKLILLIVIASASLSFMKHETAQNRCDLTFIPLSDDTYILVNHPDTFDVQVNVLQGQATATISGDTIHITGDQYKAQFKATAGKCHKTEIINKGL